MCSRLASAALLLAVLFVSGAPAHAAEDGALITRWTFEKGAAGWVAAHDCTVEASGGLLRIQSQGADPYLHGPRIDCDGPAVLKLRARSRGEGRSRLYWTVRLPSLVASDWSEDACIYFDMARDGEWHEYTVPIDTDGHLMQLRFDPCHSAGLTEVQWMELRAPSPADAAHLPVPNRAMPATIAIAQGPLRVELSTRLHRFAVTDSRTRRRWVSAPCTSARLLDARKSGPASMTLTLAARGTGDRVTCNVSVSSGGVLSYALDATPDARIAQFAYPPRLETPIAQGALLFCNRSCGQLIGQREAAQYPAKVFLCYGNLGLDMPWLGVTDLKRGDGAMLLFETPCDVLAELQADSAGRCWPQARWIAAQGRWAYTRRASYRFTASGGYVGLAKVYRRWAQQAGPWKTLAAKAKRNPNVARLKGAPDIWGVTWGDGHPTAIQFALEARAAGMTRALVNGNGPFPAPDMARLNGLGYLTSDYDNYDDVMEGPVGITSDNVEKVGLRGPDGKLARGWVDEHGQRFRRASSQAVAAAKQILPPLLKQYPYTARFLDVTPTVDLSEDYTPARFTDRRDDMANRQKLLEYVASLGLVLGGEHGKAWNAHLLDYAEGMMSGPFWWEMPAGYLQMPKTRADIKENYLHFGIDPTVRIPLWELAYHDCVVTTWYWGDTNGYYHDTAPELDDRKDLLNILYGTPPMYWVNHLDYGWNRNRTRMLQSYRDTCKWHEKVAFGEMLSHEFLTADRRVQRTRFAGGAVAVVNFGDAPRPYSDGQRKVVLAPRGFLATAPGFRQSRTMEGGQAVTRIEAPGFRSLQTTALRRSGALQVAGALAVYSLAPGQWGCLVESGKPCSIDLGQIIPGRGCRVFAVGANGERGEQIATVRPNGTLRIPGTPGLRTFAIDATALPRK